MSRLKVLSVSSCVIFIVCALLAYFSGSSIPLSIFKALVSACLVLVFLLVSNFFLLKYIPDFFENNTKTDLSKSNTIGANLDIRIDGNPSTENADKVFSSEAYFSNSNVSEEAQSIQEGENIKGKLSTSLDIKPVEFTEKDKDLNGGNESTDELPINDMQKTASDMGNAVDDGLSQAELTKGVEKDVDMLEELPDLQEFVDTSNLNTEQTKGEELMNTGTQSFFATDLSDDVSDTNLMAKAVRTVLKREI